MPDALWPLLWHVPTVMIVMVVAGLLMGQRHIGELSMFDLLISISIGTVAGAGIVDLSIPHAPVLASILGLALLHWFVTWSKMQWKWLARLMTFEPVVVIRDGKPLRKAMRRVRVTTSDLLPLLRDRGIFDMREVAYGILEPDGKLTVVKQQDYRPEEGLRRAVVLDGVLEVPVLHDLGWSKKHLVHELAQQGLAPKDVFLATLDSGGDMHVVAMNDRETPPPILH